MKRKIMVLIFSLLLLSVTSAIAQVVVVNADQVRSFLGGRKKVVIIDARTKEEYLQSHIPGAVNIMPEKMQAEAKNLPKVKTTPMIFYCRGMS
jgi:rhodanese-related sulfurtransferase